MTLEEKKAELRLLRKRDELRALRAAAPAAPDESTADQIQGMGQRLFKGQTMGYGDELAGFSRALIDYGMPDRNNALGGEQQSFGDRYRTYRDDARATDKAYQERHPIQAAALEMVGNIASPVAKIAPGAAAEGALGRAGQVAARGLAEGGAYGLGEGEGSATDQAKSALTGAAFGGAVGGVLSPIGGALARTLAKRRVQPDLVQPDGSQMPIHMAAPDTGVGRLYRDWLASIPFAKSALKQQEAPFLARAEQELAKQEGIAQQETNNLARHQWHRANDIDLNARQEAARLQGLIDEQKLADTGARDIAAATNANAAAEAARATQQAEAARNLAVLKQAVPKGSEDSVTAIGHEGMRQVKAVVDKGYADAWNSVGELTKGTIPAVQSVAEVAIPQLGKKQARNLKALSDDVQKMAEEGNFRGVDEALREARETFRKKPQMLSAIKEMRTILRDGLPDEAASQIKALDANYPNYLTAIEMSAKAHPTGGVANLSQMGSASARVGGKTRTALGEQPLRDTIYAGQVAEEAVPAVVPKRPALERTLSLQKQKRTAADQARWAKNDASVIDAAEKQYLQSAHAAGPLARAKEAAATAQRSKSSPHTTFFSGAAAAGGLGSLLAGGILPYGLALGAGVGAGRGLASRAGQRLVAGQTQAQMQLAEALRKGDTARYAELLARIAAGQATGE